MYIFLLSAGYNSGGAPLLYELDADREQKLHIVRNRYGWVISFFWRYHEIFSIGKYQGYRRYKRHYKAFCLYQ